MDEHASLRLPAPEDRPDVEPHGDELDGGSVPQFVVSQRREEGGFTDEVGHLHGRDRATARGHLPVMRCMHDLPGARESGHLDEVRPLDVADDCHSESSQRPGEALRTA